jgi:Tol biopolymer transport system component
VDWPEIAVRNLVAGTTIRITASLDGDGPDGWSLYPDISGDGKMVVFQSSAMGLIAGLKRVNTW